MKKLLLLLGLSVALLFADAYSFLDYERSYEKAKDAAIKADKKLMLIVVSDSCPWCKALAKKTLASIEVAGFIDKHFVPVLVKNDEPDTFPKSYHTDRIPVVNFINPVSDEDLWQSIGFRTTKEFMQDMQEALTDDI